MFTHDDGLNVSGRIQQFDVKNGSDFIQIEGWLVYSNGAMRDSNPFGVLRDPPRDEMKSLSIQKRYWHTRLVRAAKAFEKFHHELIVAAENGRGVKALPEDLKKLKTMHSTVNELRKKREEIDDKFNNHPAVKDRQEIDALRNQSSVEVNRSVSAAVDEINSIGI